MPLYHKNVYLPEDLNVPAGVYYLNLTGHALTAYDDDCKKFGKFDLPCKIEPSQLDLIEVDTEEDKYVLRDNEGLTYAIKFIRHNRTAIVKSLWKNDKNDNHKTLDKTRYHGGI